MINESMFADVGDVALTLTIFNHGLKPYRFFFLGLHQ